MFPVHTFKIQAMSRIDDDTCSERLSLRDGI